MTTATIRQPRRLHGLYNTGCFWPRDVQTAVRLRLELDHQVRPTRHVEDRLWQYDLDPDAWRDSLAGTVVEAEFVEGRLHKVVTRRPDPDHPEKDLCSAVVLDDRAGRATATVVTMWVNARRDGHRTLRRENYVCR